MLGRHLVHRHSSSPPPPPPSSSYAIIHYQQQMCNKVIILHYIRLRREANKQTNKQTDGASLCFHYVITLLLHY